MATKAIASNTGLTLKQKAEAIRAAKRSTQPEDRQDEGFFAACGYAAADLINGGAKARDAYTVRRAERE